MTSIQLWIEITRSISFPLLGCLRHFSHSISLRLSAVPFVLVLATSGDNKTIHVWVTFELERLWSPGTISTHSGPALRGAHGRRRIWYVPNQKGHQNKRNPGRCSRSGICPIGVCRVLCVPESNGTQFMRVASAAYERIRYIPLIYLKCKYDTFDTIRGPCGKLKRISFLAIMGHYGRVCVWHTGEQSRREIGVE